MSEEDKYSHLWLGNCPTYQLTSHLILNDTVLSSTRGSRAICPPLFWPTSALRGWTHEEDITQVPAVASTNSESVPLPTIFEAATEAQPTNLAQWIENNAALPDGPEASRRRHEHT